MKATTAKRVVLDRLNTDLGNSVDVLRLGQTLCRDIDTPVSLGVYLRIKYREFDQLALMEINPDHYVSDQSYFYDAQAVNFLRKYDSLDTTFDKKERAYQTFISGEVQCGIGNKTLRAWTNGRLRFPVSVESAFLLARHKISKLLGDLDIEEWLDNCRFGPGAAVGVAGTSDYVKLSAHPSTTVEFEPFALRFLEEFPGWVTSLSYDANTSFDLKVYPGGSYSQVPKDAKTNRNIETQPLINGFSQLGIGSMIRRRLRSVGINLDDQSRNAEAARLSSVTNKFATVDLSNASDSICVELVRWLLPPDWFHAMDITRTHRIRVNNTYRELERFCSMGNGFAFELESLIFWALAASVSENVTRTSKGLLVYGDDIVVDSRAYPLLLSVFRSAGFVINTRKSYCNSAFRESCGSDWFIGRNVRSFFLKEKPTNVASLISLANGLKRAAHRSNRNLGYDRRFAATWYTILRWIPPSVRKRLAFGYTESDDVILSGRERDGFRVIFCMRRRTDLNWFPALGTALYRVHRRAHRGSSGRSDVTAAVYSNGRSSATPNLSGDGCIYDYRRDCGRWSLRRHQHLIRADATMIWW